MVRGGRREGEKRLGWRCIEKGGGRRIKRFTISMARKEKRGKKPHMGHGGGERGGGRCATAKRVRAAAQKGAFRCRSPGIKKRGSKGGDL